MKKYKNLFVLISFTFLSFLIASFIFFNKKAKYNTSLSQSTSQLEGDMKDNQASQIILSQSTFIDRLFPEDENFDVESRFLDIFAPLGALDPLSSEKGSENIISIQNSSFGYFSKQHGLSEERSIFLMELPLKYATQDFNHIDYFQENENILNEIDAVVNSLININIMGYWSSGIIRVNNFFNDKEQNIIWEMPDTKENFYDFAKIEIHDTETGVEKLTVLENFDFEDLSKINANMASVNITTIYKCAGNNIYIIGATSNNAFGLINGADRAEEVNCGLLKNRFRIIKDKKLNSKWRFWIGR